MDWYLYNDRWDAVRGTNGKAIRILELATAFKTRKAARESLQHSDLTKWRAIKVIDIPWCIEKPCLHGEKLEAKRPRKRFSKR